MTPGKRSTRFAFGLLVFLLYVGISFLFFGGIVDYRTNYIGVGIDPFAYIWFLNWWPWAITHGLNPMISYYDRYPEGFNIRGPVQCPWAHWRYRPSPRGSVL